MRRTGKLSLLLVAGAATMLVGGCEKKAGGQVVAVVNGKEITQQELNAELGDGQLPAGAGKQAMAQLLQRVIDRKLLVEKATADGLDQSPAYLSQVRRSQDEILVSLLAQKIAKAQPLPDEAATDRFIAGNPTLFAGRKRYLLDQIVYPASDNPALLPKLRAAQTMEAVQQALQSLNIRYVRANSTLDTASIPADLGARLAALRPGEPFVVPQGDQMIVSVIRGAEATPTPAAQAKPAAADLIRREAISQAMGRIAKEERAKAKIDYQPGFAPAAGGATPAAQPGG